MRNGRRIAATVLAGALVAGGSVGGYILSAGSAKADQQGNCQASLGDGSRCTLDETITKSSSIWLQISKTATNLTNSSVSWTAVCDGTTTTGGQGGIPPYIVHVVDSNTNSCDVTATLSVVFKAVPVPTTSPTAAATVTGGWMSVDFTASDGTTATASASTGSGTSSGFTGGQSKGFAGKCLDDAKNSSSLRASIVIWTCNSGDQAQRFTYTAGEVKRNGLCLNAKGSGNSGSKVILWTCNGSPNEIWVFNTLNHEVLLKAHGFTLCLNDPGNSKKNGTQLIVYKCQNTANEHWTVP